MTKEIDVPFINVVFVNDKQNLNVVYAKSITAINRESSNDDAFFGFEVQCYQTGKVYRISANQVVSFKPDFHFGIDGPIV